MLRVLPGCHVCFGLLHERCLPFFSYYAHEQENVSHPLNQPWGLARFVRVFLKSETGRMSESRRLRSEACVAGMRYRVKASKASNKAATLRRMLGTELLCESLLLGGLPLFCCPPTLGTGVAVAVDVGLVLVCVGLLERVGDGVGAVVGAGVGVTAVAVGDGVGVGDAVQLHETWTEFIGPVKVIVSFAGQEMGEGIVMFTVTCPLG